MVGLLPFSFVVKGASILYQSFSQFNFFKTTFTSDVSAECTSRK